MRAYLRLFLGGFLGVAGLGVANAIGGMDGLSRVVDGLALALGMGVLMLGLVSRSVGWAAISAALFLAWKILGLAFPFGLAGPAAGAVWLAGVQAALAGWLGWELRGREESGTAFSGRRFVILTGVLLLAGGGIAGGGAVTLAARAIEQQSGGFVRVGLGGLELQEREFERAGQRVRLVGMIHIGRADFYQRVHDSLNGPGRAIVLLEGVTDRDGVLAGRFSYGRVAGLLGLSSQETSKLQRAEPPPDAGGNKVPKVDYRHADVDVASFSELTRECLRAISGVLREPNVQSVLRLAGDEDSPFRDPGADAAISRDLIERRNAHLLVEIRRALGADAIVIVPWGALHLPGIDAALRAEGFRETRREARVAIAW